MVTPIWFFAARASMSGVRREPVILSPYCLEKFDECMIARRHQSGIMQYFIQSGSHELAIWYPTKTPIPSGIAISEDLRMVANSSSLCAS